MVKHNKNFKSKKKQSLKKKALRKTKRKGGKKSKKNIGGELFWEECYKRKARFNVTENDYNKTYQETTSAIHGYAFSGDFKETLHYFYINKWKAAVDNGDSEAKKYFGKPKTGSKIPTIQFALDRAKSCDNSTVGRVTNTHHFQNKNNPNQEGLALFQKGDTKYLKFFRFNYDDQYEFSNPIVNIPTQPKQQQQPKLEQASEKKFLKNLKKYGFKIIDNRNILECDIRLPSYIGYDRKDFKDAITTDLQKSDSNFINNEWYVFYKHHDWNNQNYSSPAQHTYFQYGNPGTKITGRKFIDLLHDDWTPRRPYSKNQEREDQQLHFGTRSIEKERERDNLVNKNRNEAENDVKENNLVVQNFRLTREMVSVMGVITDSCKNK